MSLTEADKTRLFTKAAHKDGCLVWMGARYLNGYGKFTKNKKDMKAHRVAYFFHNGSWPDGVVRHMCHNKLCILKDHLVDGTQAQNVDDTVSAGNQHRPIGILNGRCKLSEADVRSIKSHPQSYGVASQLARKYGVSHTVIRDIRSGKTWDHIRSY